MTSLKKKASSIFATMSKDELADRRCPYCLSTIWMRKDPITDENYCRNWDCTVRRINDKCNAKVYKKDELDTRQSTGLARINESLAQEAEKIVAAGTAPASTLDRLAHILAKSSLTHDDLRAIDQIVRRYSRR